ncbi:secretin N-terminal domain-containing protein [Ideonella sp. DXS22W]|uniref:Secretin N-terminal domain-containing protein n=1 Tax=Pseudaquabacterium inlustre TaxID=2984192 RepID=A0ABU9CPI7_9BURK
MNLHRPPNRSVSGTPRATGRRLALRHSVLCTLACSLAACAGVAPPPAPDAAHTLQRAGALAAASAAAPTDARLRTELLLLQERQLLASQARAAERLEAGDADGAEAAAREALALVPRDERAQALLAEAGELRRLQPLLAGVRQALQAGEPAQAEALAQAALAQAPASRLAQAAALSAAQAQQAARAERVARRSADEAASPWRRPVSLQVRDGGTRATLEALARHGGLNLVFDAEVRRDLKTSLTVQDAPLGDVIDLVLLQAGLARREVGSRAVFVYPATEARLREHQELDVRSFHVANADVKQVAAALRTLLKLRDVVVDERGSTLLLREPPAVLAVAERIVRAHDRADPEVMLELEVLEVSRDRLSQLGLRLPDGLSVSVPATEPGGGTTLGALRRLDAGQLLVSPLGATLNLRLQESDARVLASPRIRARHRQTARVMIGEKVPVITNTVTPLQSGGSVVTGAIQYLDVGIKLQVEPEVFPDAQVGIRLSLEVSNIAREIPGPSGSLAYQIGTRNAETQLRLADGQTQVLGGLISDQAREAAARVPGLGQLPLLGRLFSSVSRNGESSEVVLAITPRIVRGVATLPEAARQFASGTESRAGLRALNLDPLPTGSSVASIPSIPSVTTAAPAAPGAADAPPGAADAPRPPGAAADATPAAPVRRSRPPVEAPAAPR